MQDNKLGALMGGIVLGSIVGATAALMMAPKSGKEMREDIVESAEKTKGAVKEVKEKAKDWGAQVQETIKPSSDAERLKKQAKDIFSKFIDEIEGVVQKAQTK